MLLELTLVLSLSTEPVSFSIHTPVVDYQAKYSRSRLSQDVKLEQHLDEVIRHGISIGKINRMWLRSLEEARQKRLDNTEPEW